jgi:putative DNA primase/helicase
MDIDFAALIEPVATRLFSDKYNARLSKPGVDLRFGTNGSLSVNPKTGEWYDHEEKVGGGVLDLIARELGGDHASSMEWLRDKGFVQQNGANGASRRNGAASNGSGKKIDKTYDYTDERGICLFQAVRYESKDFRQRRTDGNGGWIWNLDDVRRVLYRLPEVIAAVADGKTIHIVEGEKDADNLRELGFIATTNPMGAGKWDATYNEFLRRADVVIIGDNDDSGRKHVADVGRQLTLVAKRVRVLNIATHWPDCPEKGDISDWFAAGCTAEMLAAAVEIAPDWKPTERPRLQPLSLTEFLAQPIKSREMLLDPIIPEKGLAMVYGTRGTGKTMVALGLAYALATGTRFLKWSAPKPRRVLLIDGEMPAAALQERLSWIALGVGGDPKDDLKILVGDLIEEGGIGNIGSEKVQAELEPHLEGVDLLILDNLSTLTAVIRDNDAESWGPIQEYLLRLRRRNISVLIVHHAGKGGQQRGTSRREDVLDTVIKLARPSDYEPTEGARFEVHFEKGRGMVGEQLKPFEAKFEVRADKAIWTTREIEDVKLAQVRCLLEDGMSVRDIASEVGISKSAVQRMKTRIDAEQGGDSGDDE